MTNQQPMDEGVFQDAGKWLKKNVTKPLKKAFGKAPSRTPAGIYNPNRRPTPTKAIQNDPFNTELWIQNLQKKAAKGPLKPNEQKWLNTALANRRQSLSDLPKWIDYNLKRLPKPEADKIIAQTKNLRGTPMYMAQAALLRKQAIKPQTGHEWRAQQNQYGQLGPGNTEVEPTPQDIDIDHGEANPIHPTWRQFFIKQKQKAAQMQAFKKASLKSPSTAKSPPTLSVVPEGNTAFMNRAASVQPEFEFPKPEPDEEEPSNAGFIDHPKGAEDIKQVANKSDQYKKDREKYLRNLPRWTAYQLNNTVPKRVRKELERQVAPYTGLQRMVKLAKLIKKWMDDERTQGNNYNMNMLESETISKADLTKMLQEIIAEELQENMGGYVSNKDMAKDPKHIKGERWRIKFQSASDLKKHGNTEMSSVKDNYYPRNWAGLGLMIKTPLCPHCGKKMTYGGETHDQKGDGQLWNCQHCNKEYVRLGKDGPLVDPSHLHETISPAELQFILKEVVNEMWIGFQQERKQLKESEWVSKPKPQHPREVLKLIHSLKEGEGIWFSYDQRGTSQTNDWIEKKVEGDEYVFRRGADPKYAEYLETERDLIKAAVDIVRNKHLHYYAIVPIQGYKKAPYEGDPDHDIGSYEINGPDPIEPQFEARSGIPQQRQPTIRSEEEIELIKLADRAAMSLTGKRFDQLDEPSQRKLLKNLEAVLKAYKVI